MLMDLIIPGIRDPCLLPVEEASDSKPHTSGGISLLSIVLNSVVPSIWYMMMGETELLIHTWMFQKPEAFDMEMMASLSQNKNYVMWQTS
jgi:hypothetical protein